MSTEKATDRLLEPLNRAYLTQETGSLKSSSNLYLRRIILPWNVIRIGFTYQIPVAQAEVCGTRM